MANYKKNKKEDLNPTSIKFDEDTRSDIDKHRNITGIPMVRHIKKLIAEDKKNNPKDYGINGQT